MNEEGEPTERRGAAAAAGSFTAGLSVPEASVSFGRSAMHSDLDAQFRALIATDPTEADMQGQYRIVAIMEADAEPFRFVAAVVRFIEEHPDVDFGSPGPLVHFVEGFHEKGYEKVLVGSFRRRPTAHTTMMLNRLINGSSGDLKASYVAMLRDSSERSDVDTWTLQRIIHFCSLH